MNVFFHEIVIKFEDFCHLFKLRFRDLIKCSSGATGSDHKQKKTVQSKLFNEREDEIQNIFSFFKSNDLRTTLMDSGENI